MAKHPLIQAIEAYTEGADATAVRQGVDEMKIILQSVATQNASGVQFEAMSELDGYENHTQTVVEWQTAFDKGTEIVKAADEDEQAADNTIRQNASQGLVPHLQGAIDARQQQGERTPFYGQMHQAQWTMRDIEALVQQDSGLGSWMEMQRTVIRGGVDVSIPMDMVRQGITEVRPIGPRDTVAVSARKPLPLLDLINIVSDPRSNVVYHRPTGPTTGGGTREWGGTVAEAQTTYERISKEKKGIGVLQPIELELGVASPSMVANETPRLIERVMEIMQNQIIAGDDAGQNWHSLDNQLTGAAFTSAATAVRAYDAFRDRVGSLMDRGESPNGIFTNRTVADEVYERLAGRNFAQADLIAASVNGEPRVRGVQVYVTSGLPANTAFIGDVTPRSIEVETLNDMVISVSEDARFATNEAAVRVVLSGNVKLYDKFAFFKLTNTAVLT